MIYQEPKELTNTNPFYNNLADAASTAAGIEEFTRIAAEQPKMLDTIGSLSPAFAVERLPEAPTSEEHLEGGWQLNGCQVGKVMFMRMNANYLLAGHHRRYYQNPLAGEGL